MITELKLLVCQVQGGVGLEWTISWLRNQACQLICPPETHRRRRTGPNRPWTWPPEPPQASWAPVPRLGPSAPPSRRVLGHHQLRQVRAMSDLQKYMRESVHVCECVLVGVLWKRGVEACPPKGEMMGQSFWPASPESGRALTGRAGVRCSCSKACA